MRVVVTRDSVAAGDDADAPHERVVEHPLALAAFETDWIGLAAALIPSLPSVFGGGATWVLSSGQPLAVWSPGWPAPRLVRFAGRVDLAGLDRRGEALHVHWSYFTAPQPEVVLDVLARLTLRGPG